MSGSLEGEALADGLILIWPSNESLMQSALVNLICDETDFVCVSVFQPHRDWLAIYCMFLY